MADFYIARAKKQATTKEEKAIYRELFVRNRNLMNREFKTYKDCEDEIAKSPDADMLMPREGMWI